MKRLALLFALGGCDSVFGLDTPKRRDAGANGDSGSGSADCSTKVGSYGKNGNAGWFQYCPVPGVKTFSDITTINTDAPAMCADHETFACLIESGTITLNGVVTVTGTRPLILAASTEIAINGVLDVSSSATGNGPGADPQVCSQTGIGPIGASGLGGGGGAGASWSSMGGDGGTGGGAGLGVAGGTAAMPSNQPTMLRGGCAGMPGGDATGGSGGGDGGPGGGAVYLMSPQIVLDEASQVEAVGMYGTGGKSGGTTASGGGAGGGTGGLIVFDTATLKLPPTGGFVFANGGGGGAGGDTANGMDGMRSSGPSMAGMGGLASVNGGGIGGTGALGIASAGIGGNGGGTTPHAGGGGGGGGQGFILLFTMNATPNPTDTRYSPPFIIE